MKYESHLKYSLYYRSMIFSSIFNLHQIILYFLIISFVKKGISKRIRKNKSCSKDFFDHLHLVTYVKNKYPPRSILSFLIYPIETSKKKKKKFPLLLFIKSWQERKTIYLQFTKDVISKDGSRIQFSRWINNSFPILPFPPLFLPCKL